MECKILIDFGKCFCKFRLFDFKNICLFYFSLVFRKSFIEKFNLKFNLNCKKKFVNNCR